MKFWRHAWRCLRLLGFLSAFVAAAFAIAIWHRGPTQAMAAGKPVETLDVISLQIDILSLTMAAIGIGLAVIALFGYQALKEAAEARAEAAAKEVAEREIRKIAPPIITRVATDTLRTLNRESAIPTSDNVDLTDAIGKEADGGK